MAWLRGMLRRPEWVVVVVGGIVGLFIVFVVPPFAGIDEPSHFARAWHQSDGNLLADDPVEGAEGVGVCLPADIQASVQKQILDNWYGGFVKEDWADPNPTCTTDRGEAGRFVDIATFSWYSPVGYLPQTIGVGVARLFDQDAAGVAAWGRVTSLAVFLALAHLAVRRTPHARWGLAVVALLPVTLVQAATSLSPDVMATAASLLVVSSAMRFLDPARVFGVRRFLVEAIGLGSFLALTKPTYAIAAALYLLPLLRRATRSPRWPRVVAGVVPLVVSGVWQASQRSRFICDARFFGLEPDPDRQMDLVLGRPDLFLARAAEVVVTEGHRWLHQSVVVGDQAIPDWAMPWPLWSVLVVLGGFVLLGLQREVDETVSLGTGERMVAGALFGAGVLSVLLGLLVYCQPPVLEWAYFPHARHFVPLLPLAAVALAPSGAMARRLALVRVPVALVLGIVYVPWLWALVGRNG